ncbi:MAG: ABC transporter ATP-binding protein [Elusimicrobiota bacterium]
MSAALKIEDLTVRYKVDEGETVAVDHIDLEVAEGELFALLGPNGAGKTSIISAITGIITHQTGDIRIFGHHAATPEAKRLVGLVPQELVSYGFFNVTEVLEFTSGYFGIRDNGKRIDELLDRLQLTSERYKLISQLSGGLKRRMLIARALVHSPKVLLLDEPSAGVDVELRAILLDYIKDLNRRGTTILLTTHYLEEAQRLCERSAIINRGKVLALDETGSIISEMSERLLTITLRAEMPGAVMRPDADKGLLEVHRKGNVVRATVVGKMSLQTTLEHLGIPLANIRDLKTDEGDLEHAFLRLLEEDRAR